MVANEDLSWSVNTAATAPIRNLFFKNILITRKQGEDRQKALPAFLAIINYHPVSLSLFLSVMLLSIGTPGIPGSAIAMTAMLFTQFGIPAGAIGYVIPLIMLSDYGRTMSNVTGDAVVTAVVAKSENLLNLQMMRRKK